MKKLIYIVLLSFGISCYSQVFNTAETLKRGGFSLGLNPAYYDDDLGIFLHGGVGIKSGIDFALKFGIVDGDDYFGGDLEWKLIGNRPAISLVTGGHVQGDFGLDLGLNLSFPITGGVAFYTGADSDINFYNNDTQFLFWVPVGVEIKLKSSIGFLFEGEIPVTDLAFPIFGGGIAFYF